MGHLLDWYTDPEKFQGEVNPQILIFMKRSDPRLLPDDGYSSCNHAGTG